MQVTACSSQLVKFIRRRLKYSRKTSQSKIECLARLCYCLRGGAVVPSPCKLVLVPRYHSWHGLYLTCAVQTEFMCRMKLPTKYATSVNQITLRKTQHLQHSNVATAYCKGLYDRRAMYRRNFKTQRRRCRFSSYECQSLRQLSWPRREGNWLNVDGKPSRCTALHLTLKNKKTHTTLIVFAHFRSNAVWVLCFVQKGNVLTICEPYFSPSSKSPSMTTNAQYVRLTL